MKRDFTDENYQHFCSLIEQVNKDSWFGISDWFGDRYLDIKHWLGDLGLYDYTRNIEEYHREVLDRKNTSVSVITNVFDKVSEIDTRYASETEGHFGYYKNSFAEYQKFTQGLLWVADECISGISGGKSIGSLISSEKMNGFLKEIAGAFNKIVNPVHYTADTFYEISDEYKDAFVKMFEMKNPEHAKEMQRVLSDPDLTDSERRDIKFMVYSAPEPYRTLYLEHADRYNIVVYDYGDSDSDNVGTSCYWSYTDKIYLEDYDETFLDNPRGPYNTFFHECGHAFDEYEQSGYYNVYTENYTYNGKSMNELITEDVREYVDNYIDNEYPNLSESQKEQLMESLNLSDSSDFDYGGDASELSRSLRSYRNDIIDHMSDDLGGDVNEAASDVYGGVTNNALIGKWGHRDDSYWYNGSSPTGAQESELWAEFFAAKMTNDEEALASIKSHFPRAYDAMEAMANDMANN